MLPDFAINRKGRPNDRFGRILLKNSALPMLGTRDSIL
jgi:hypothetical protein